MALEQSDTYCATDGPFGRAEVLGYTHDLVVHAHSQTQLAFWMGGGSAHAHIGAQRLAFGRDRAVAVNRLVSHDLCLDRVGATAVFLMLYIDDAVLHACCHPGCGPFLFPVAPIALDEALQGAAWKIMDDVLNPAPAAACSIDADVRSLLAPMLALAGLRPSAPALPQRRSMVDYRLRVAMAHMRDNLDKPTVAEELADVVGLSRSRLCALFHDELGTSPHVFWNTVRLEAATRRLDTDHANLTELALDLGFSTSGNFSRFFREHTGVTPSAYRRYRHAA